LQRSQNGISDTFGVHAGGNCYGKEMSFVDYRMTLYSKIKVNPAIELDASMNLTSQVYGPTGTDATAAVSGAQGYVNFLYVPISNRPVATDVPNTFVTLQWLKLGIKTPMVNISTESTSSSTDRMKQASAAARPGYEVGVKQSHLLAF
jgi:hypothetical protein